MSIESRLRAASWPASRPERRLLITRGDALAILGKGHPGYAVVVAMPCEGEHKIGYCCGPVVSLDAVLALPSESQP